MSMYLKYCYCSPSLFSFNVAAAARCSVAAPSSLTFRFSFSSLWFFCSFRFVCCVLCVVRVRVRCARACLFFVGAVAGGVCARGFFFLRVRVFVVFLWGGTKCRLLPVCSFALIQSSHRFLTMPSISKILLAAACATLAPAVQSAGCNGHSTPGAPNTIPVDENPAYKLIKTTKNGKLYSVGSGDDALNVRLSECILFFHVCQFLVLVVCAYRLGVIIRFVLCLLRWRTCGATRMTWASRRASFCVTRCVPSFLMFTRTWSNRSEMCKASCWS